MKQPAKSLLSALLSTSLEESTINDVSSDQSNTIIFALPIEILRAFENNTRPTRNPIPNIRSVTITSGLLSHCAQGGILVYLCDAGTFETSEKFDLIFLDPPYAAGLYAPTLSSLLSAGMLKPTTLVVCESDSAEIFSKNGDLASKFKEVKVSKYSKTVITILSLYFICTDRIYILD